ncbi:ORF16-lacZ fusion protein [Salmonella enterica subsp. enterica serovar Choleraesuis str. SC-B67]|uniref:ORF16-lacZ fusion protein n=1 Tax=Salmonella choleraesuis (strain SC-B67) TaxID=321314 RepID=Q57L44_SALCH|nr:ORF16-lacZ fusion protein [Salmonella enterica subsp. enterica serovar Choleraesuis str. SC-B67]
MINWRKVGMTSSHHGPYDQGYTRATMAHTKRSDLARASGPHKVRRSPDWSLQLDSMKSESLVIVDQNATVNTFPGPCTHRPVTPLARGWAQASYASLTFGRALTTL